MKLNQPALIPSRSAWRCSFAVNLWLSLLEMGAL